MGGHALISTEVLASYAADAAREVEGVRGLHEPGLPRSKAVRVTCEEGAVSVELHLDVEWGVSIPAVGRAVQERVADYLKRMADVATVHVDVVVDGVGPS